MSAFHPLRTSARSCPYTMCPAQRASRLRLVATEALSAEPATMIAKHLAALDAPLEIVGWRGQPTFRHLGPPPNRPNQSRDARQQGCQAEHC
jgi:hypothetical protein